MTPSESSEARLHLPETVMRQFRRMMELNADVDRNLSDAVFARAGGQIRYVLDENIFEMFIRPAKRAEYVSSFFSGPVSGGSGATFEPSAAPQSAMICSEYLLSGELPGQQAAPVLMTEWHFWELHDQMRVRRAELHAKVQEDIEILQFFDSLGSLTDLEAIGAGALDQLLAVVDKRIAQDAQHLRAQGWPDDVLSRSVIAWEAARLLAWDQVMGPIQQLNRIFSDEIAPRLRPLHLEFPLPPALRSELAEQTREWMRRLSTEQRRRSERPGAERIELRPPGSLASDARSLAYILWVATRRSSPGARVVFVTGDHLMFDAYRRWHAEQASSEPFVLRRPIQYAPFLNFNDSPNDVSNGHTVFERTREAIEVPLIIFNLQMRPETTSPGQAAPVQIAAQRELLLLQLADLPAITAHPPIAFFLNRLEADWWQERRERFRELRQAWQHIERVAIGANYQLVSRRLNSAQRMRAEFFAEIGAEASGPVILDYARKVLDRIVVDSLRLWFPLALEFIGTINWDESAKKIEPRAPIVLRLSLFAPDGSVAAPINVNVLLEKDAETWGRDILDVERNPNLLHRQHIVFAVAACFALRLALWSQADRYADLASAAADMLATSETGGTAHDDVAECRYLHALTTRFRVGSFSPYRAATTENVWGRWVQRAETSLTRCEAYHHQPDSGPRQILRELRAVSERAALRLFYATWLAVLEQQALPLTLSIDEGFQSLRAAAEDLRHCFALANEVDVAGLSTERAGFFRSVETQYLVNAAAAEFLAHLFAMNHHLELPLALIDGAIAARLRQIANPQSATLLPSSARIDICSFLVVRWRDEEAGQWLRELFSMPSASTLPIDRALLSAIRRVTA
jgi:hypothetical protein